MKQKLCCQRCGNEDPAYFFNDRGIWYCRRCIAFGRIDVGEKPIGIDWQRNPFTGTYQLSYPLTDLQKETADKVCAYLAKGEHVLIYAATGAGKTELTMEAIGQYLRKGKRVGFAIARRQVVLEIAQRLQDAFPKLHVIAVCEGYTKVTKGDLIVCTMHQLYRYPKGFDLLIMDEVDAFPYRGNALLKQMAMNACTGQLLYLTATPDDEMLKEVESGSLKQVVLFERPHGYPLIVPKLIHAPGWLLHLYLWQFLRKNHQEQKQTIVFVPTIAMSNWLDRCYRYFFSCSSISSESEERDECLQQFRDKKKEVLFATTVLERGITIEDVQIAVLHCEHKVFTAASLIQMIGRVGRKKEHPYGKGLFLCTYVTKQTRACMTELKKMNDAMLKRKRMSDETMPDLSM